MNESQIINFLVPVGCQIIGTVIAYIALKRRADVAVSFTGTPVDKKEFDAHVAEYKANNHAVWAKMEADRIAALSRSAQIEAAVASLEKSAEMLDRACGLLSLRLDNQK